jgi:hypothetical protein
MLATGVAIAREVGAGVNVGAIGVIIQRPPATRRALVIFGTVASSTN